MGFIFIFCVIIIILKIEVRRVDFNVKELNIFMILIDVRTKGEYEGGHINGAINHDIMDIMQGIFPNVDKNEKITLYCESGNRSMMAKSMMENAGFKNIIDAGGMNNLI